jgi:hypothetical protein
MGNATCHIWHYCDVRLPLEANFGQTHQVVAMRNISELNSAFVGFE